MIPVGAVVAVIVILVILAIAAAARSIKVVQQYEKGIIYRFGRVLPEIRGPGLTVIRPIGDRITLATVSACVLIGPTLARSATSVLTLWKRPIRPVGGASITTA